MYYISCCSCFFLTPDHWPLRTTCCPLPAVSCALHIANCSFQSISPDAQKSRYSGVPPPTRAHPPTSKPHPPSKRNSPAQAPGRIVFATQYAKPGALRWGRSRRGRLGGTGLSLRGGSLQGLLHRWESSQAGPSKAFSNGGV